MFTRCGGEKRHLVNPFDFGEGRPTGDLEAITPEPSGGSRLFPKMDALWPLYLHTEGL